MTGSVTLHLPFIATFADLKSWSRFSARKA